jgi:hypothetical protein
MAPAFSWDGIARGAGFASAWAFFTAALALATRPMGIGPGFSNPIPYAMAAILLCGAGYGIRHWLREGAGRPSGPADAGTGAWRRLGRGWLAGLRAFFKGTAACNNFILLTAAYFAGIGLTSLFIRKRRPPAASESHWQPLDLGKQEADAYYRPF